MLHLIELSRVIFQVLVRSLSVTAFCFYIITSVVYWHSIFRVWHYQVSWSDMQNVTADAQFLCKGSFFLGIPKLDEQGQSSWFPSATVFQSWFWAQRRNLHKKYICFIVHPSTSRKGRKKFSNLVPSLNLNSTFILFQSISEHCSFFSLW